jgi:hypothetical protein
MRYGMWNTSLYRAGFLTTDLKELLKCILNLMAVKELRWDGGGTEPAGEYTFFTANGMRIVN